MTITLLQSLLIAFLYYVSSSGFWFFGINTFETLWKPLVAGTIVGVILGEPMQGMLIGATINLVYIGFVAVANVLPSDPGLAGYVCTAVAIASGLSAEESLAIAVPVATLGGLLDTFVRSVVFANFSNIAGEKTKEGDMKGMFLFNVVFPQIAACLTYGTVAFLGVYFGAPVVNAVIEKVPEWLINGVAVAGGLLPSIGIAMLMQMLDNKYVLPTFFVCFVISQYFGLPVLVIAAILAIFGYAVVFKDDDSSLKVFNKDVENKEKVRTLDNKTLRKVFVDWNFCCEAGAGYVYYQAISFAHALGLAMQKWYPEKEELGKELGKHVCFYTTECTYGSPILGIALAMEEDRYLNKGTDLAPSPEAIIGIRSALMGPFASVGDTFRQGIVDPIIAAFCISLAMSGSYAGPILMVVIQTALAIFVGWFLFKFGYTFGKDAVAKLMGGGLMQKILTMASIVGAGVIGYMCANYVHCNLGIVINIPTGAEPFILDLQTGFLDTIMSGILPFGVTVGVYSLLKKGNSPTKVLFILFVAGIVLGSLGILV